jgi:carbonic anhydrase/acetyltransferase-like protein (isoleucine patch superfamily)
MHGVRYLICRRRGKNDLHPTGQPNNNAAARGRKIPGEPMKTVTVFILIACAWLADSFARERLERLEQIHGSELMPIYQLGDDKPEIPSTAYISAEATIIGKVSLGERVSVWPGAVVRGDNDSITIGEGSNVQDNAVLHTDPGFPLAIGANVTIGHQAMLHGCTVGDGTLIGIQAVVMNGAVIGRDCIVGAAALVPEGKIFGDGKLVIGVPAKVARELSAEEIEKMHRAAPGYVKRQEMYKEKLKRID